MKKKVINLVIGLLFIVTFVFAALPLIDKFFGLVDIRNNLIEEDIEAGAWFYIFVESAGASSEKIRHSLKYTPKQNGYSNDKR